MQKMILTALIFISLSVSAQQKDSAVYTLKGDLQYYNVLLDNLQKLKSVSVFMKSPYEQVAVIDELIANIKKQIEPQIQKQVPNKEKPKQ